MNNTVAELARVWPTAQSLATSATFDNRTTEIRDDIPRREPWEDGATAVWYHRGFPPF